MIDVKSTLILTFLFFLNLPACKGEEEFLGSSGKRDSVISVNNAQYTGDVSSELKNSLSEQKLDSDAALQEACANDNGDFEYIEQTLLFKERKDCRFGTSPNLDRRQAYIQAFETSNQELNLPNDGVVCEIDLISETKNGSVDQTIHYDDFLFLAIDNNIIFASNNNFAKTFESSAGFYQWNFKNLIGKKISDFESKKYCIPEAAVCQLPGHDQVGDIELTLGAGAMAPIALKTIGQPSISIDIHATGDNDDEDCFHTDIQLKVKSKYLRTL